MKLHLIYNPNSPRAWNGREVRVHKAGCRDIGRDLRGATSDMTFDWATQAEAATDWWGDFIAGGEMTEADALNYTDFLPCTAGLPEGTTTPEGDTAMTTPEITTTQAILAAEVRNHADFAGLLDTWDDARLLEVIGKARTLKTAMAKVALAVAIPANPVPEEDAAQGGTPSPEEDGKAAAEAAAEAARKAEKAAAAAAKKAEAEAASNARRVALDEKAAARLAARPEDQRKAITDALAEHPGYIAVWPKAAWTTLKLADPEAAGEAAPAWMILCNTHGEAKAIASSKAAEAEGKKDTLPTWCKGHAADAKAAAKAEKAAAK